MIVLMPLPHADFDPSEVAVSWRILTDAGHHVVFATPDARPARADAVMTSGIGLDLWSRVPLLRALRLVGLALRADRNARRAYAALIRDAAFREPVAWSHIGAQPFDALLLPGGHAQGMREYLESALLQEMVASCFDADRPVAAICHGVVLAARSRSPRSGRSVLHGRRTTALTWHLERAAWRVSRYAGRWWDRDYYRTYREAPGEPAGYRSVQAEVTRCLAQPADFLDVPAATAHRWRKTCGLFRDTPTDPRPAFVVRDGNYVSARWPGDAHTFARTFSDVLSGIGQRSDRGLPEREPPRRAS